MRTHQGRRLGRRPRHNATPVLDDSDDCPTTGPLQYPGGTSRRPGPDWRHSAPSADRQPHRVQSVRPPGPWARAPVPGRDKYFNSPHSVVIPQRPGDPGRPGLLPLSPAGLCISNLTDSFALLVLGRLKINRRIFWDHHSISATTSRALQSQTNWPRLSTFC